MRTGRSIMVLEGHVKALLALDFAPGGGLLASGSEDHTARVWDLRQRRCLYTLPGHRSLVSQARHWALAGSVCLWALPVHAARPPLARVAGAGLGTGLLCVPVGLGS